MLLVSGCYNSNSGGTTQAVPAPGFEDVEERVVIEDAPNDEEADDDPAEVEGDIIEIDIIAKSWEFVPSTIEVNLGDRVELHIKSIDVTHGFRLPDFGIDEVLQPNQDVHVNFIADKKGTFPFACSVPCGSGHGRMTGQLIVR